MGPRIANWGIIRPFLKVGKLNRTLTIPAFSVRCGLNNVSLYTGQSDAVGSAPGLTLDLSTAFTYEAWIKCFSRPAGIYRFIVGYGSGAGNDTYSCLRLNGQKLQCQVFILGFELTFDSTVTISEDTWTHVCVTFNNSEIKFYINGELDTTHVLVGPIDNAYFFNGLRLFCDFAAPNGSFYKGSIGQAAVWNSCLTDTQIRYQYNKVRNVVAANGIDDNLVAYWTFIPPYKIREWISLTDATVLPPLGTSIIVKDFFELGYGASFIPIQFQVIATQTHSLKFPVTRPSGANFGLYLSWLDNNNELQRRKLFDPEVGSIDINVEPEDYNGEELPTTYTLEVWNIDGYESVDLTTAMILDTSILSNPQSSIDHAKVALTAPSQRTSLYEPFPLTGFPLAFDNPATDWLY